MRGILLSLSLAALGCSNIDNSSSSASATDESVRADRHHDGGGHGVGSAYADVYLTHSNAQLLQTTDTPWTLSKTGAVDTSSHTVTWTITSAQGSSSDSTLVVDGDLDLSNIGNGPATLGNIVVNLQVRESSGSGGSSGWHHHWWKHSSDCDGWGHGWGWGWGWGWRWDDGDCGSSGSGDWTTVASDVANATNDINATSANVVADDNVEDEGTFSTGSASGKLYFMDRATNTVFALVPEVTLAKFSDTPLLFSATFDNSLLGFTKNTDVRIEVIVSFGNHPVGGPGDGENIDINGNGTIDPDEHRVRSVSNTFERTVPATQAANSTLTVADSAANITTTGTVTFTDAVFDLGHGTASATYDAGGSGGSITNCATGTGTGITDTIGSASYTITAGQSLTACDTETIAQDTCVAGTTGCGWHSGDLVTYSSVVWGDSGGIPAMLEADYDTVYAPVSDVLVVGNAATGFTMTFTSADTIIAYLPSSGTPGPLTVSLLDPATSASGSLGGEVVALNLNITFTDANLLGAATAVSYGDLHVCGLTDTTSALNGETVRQVLGTANTVLSGASSSIAPADLFVTLSSINSAFNNGAVSTFAQNSLVNGACP